nr:MAG TPA: hypothetical protein [Caudoviricetes sp.]
MTSLPLLASAGRGVFMPHPQPGTPTRPFQPVVTQRKDLE